MRNKPPRARTQNITATTLAEASAWAKHLGCTVAELRIALRAVGTLKEHVQTYLAALNGHGPEAPGAQGSADEPKAMEREQEPVRFPPRPASRYSEL